MEKRIYIETYGCQMNEHDTERILRLLEGAHYLETKDAREADFILINTCSVREKPEHKVYSALGRYKWLKEKKGAVIGVAGCVAQQEGDRLLDRIPYLDMVIGTHAIPMLPQLLQKIEVSGERVCETSFDPEGNILRQSFLKSLCDKVKSYVTIMQGCDHFCSFCIVPYVRGREQSRPGREIIDHFCSFCIVPYVRGREQSRPRREIIEEVERLVEMGVKEVCLLGQNVNGYGKGLEGEISFSELLHRINEIEGLDRIRFTTSHPKDLSEELIQAFSKLSETLRAHPSSFSIGFG